MTIVGDVPVAAFFAVDGDGGACCWLDDEAEDSLDRSECSVRLKRLNSRDEGLTTLLCSAAVSVDDDEEDGEGCSEECLILLLS